MSICKSISKNPTNEEDDINNSISISKSATDEEYI